MYDKKAAKQRYFDKVYAEAPMIPCACGCGQMIKSKDKYARDVLYVNGHNTRKYEDPTQYKREWNHRNREQRQDYKMERYRKKKVELIKLKGGKCVCCGYHYNGENGAAFQFHHRNPDAKEFQLGQNLADYAWEKVLAEAEKCDLLCANCHFLTHGTKF